MWPRKKISQFKNGFVDYTCFTNIFIDDYKTANSLKILEILCPFILRNCIVIVCFQALDNVLWLILALKICVKNEIPTGIHQHVISNNIGYLKGNGLHLWNCFNNVTHLRSSRKILFVSLSIPLAEHCLFFRSQNGDKFFQRVVYT